MNLGDLEITSDSFEHGGEIPARHANDQDDLSPALRWEGVPDDTEELVIICHDPDAPLVDGFTHWLVYGIPPEVGGLDEGEGDAHTQGQTSFGQAGYGGPLPPPGHGDHHYFFHLYALDTPLDGDPGLSRSDLLERMDGNIIEQARVVGRYAR